MRRASRLGSRGAYAGAALLARQEFGDGLLRGGARGSLVTMPPQLGSVRYLACDASTNVTGHILKFDGGWTAW